MGAVVVGRRRGAARRRLRGRYVRWRSTAFVGVRELVYVLVRRSGLAWTLRALGPRRRVAVLVYHNPEPRLFARHLRYIAGSSRLIPLDTLVDALHSGDWSRIPRRAVVLTFDDGHAGNRALLDLLRGFGARPTIFLCSQIVGTRRRYWYTAVEPRVRQELLALPDDVRRDRLEREFGFSETAEDADRQALDLEELAEMLPHVDFQAHTRFHPLLPACADERCREEVAGSKAEVERLTGRSCEHFAYPQGAYGEREVAAVRAAGFRSARTTEIGWNVPGTDPYRLKVLGMPDGASVDALATQLAGIPLLRELVFLR